MGQKTFGISGGEAEIYLTIHTWTNEKMRVFKSQVENEITAITKKHGLKLKRD
jgi:hypothetical protein